MPSTQIVVDPSLRTSDFRFRLSTFYINNRQVVPAILAVAIAVSIIPITAVSSVSGFTFVSLLFYLIPLSVFLSAVTLYCMIRTSSKKMVYIQVNGYENGDSHEYFYANLIHDLKNVEKDCQVFRETASLDGFLEDSVAKIEATAEKLEWDIACNWLRVKPYLRKGSTSTRTIVSNNIKEYTLQVRELETMVINLTDASFKYKVVEKAENHLKVIQTDIQIMIDSLEEIWTHSQLALNKPAEEVINIPRPDTY